MRLGCLIVSCLFGELFSYIPKVEAFGLIV